MVTKVAASVWQHPNEALTCKGAVKVPSDEDLDTPCSSAAAAAAAAALAA